LPCNVIWRILEQKVQVLISQHCFAASEAPERIKLSKIEIDLIAFSHTLLAESMAALELKRFLIVFKDKARLK